MLVLPRRNRLIFPAGRRRGVERSDCVFSVAAGDAWYNRAQPERFNLGNANATLQEGFDSEVGPWTKCSTVGFGSDANWYAYPASGAGISTVDGLTFAAIMKTPPVADGFVACTFCTHRSGFGSTGFGLIFFSSFGFIPILNSSGSASSAITIAADTPYFCIMSVTYGTPGLVNSVVVNLRSGQVQTDSIAPSSTDPTFFNTINIVAGYQDTQSSRGGNIKHSAGMIIERAVKQDTLKLIAQDPWSLWYPQPQPRRKRVGVSITQIQFLRPDNDAAIGSWTDEVGGTTNIFNSIDETSPNDSDYIISGVGSNDVARFRLSDLTSAPGNAAVVKYRIFKDTASNQVDLTITLKEGSTIIASWVHTDISTTPTTFMRTLSPSEYASITDFNNLFIEFEKD